MFLLNFGPYYIFSMGVPFQFLLFISSKSYNCEVYSTAEEECVWVGVWTEECQSLGLESSVNGTVYSTSPAYIGLLTNN